LLFPAVMVYRCLQGQAPRYLADHLIPAYIRSANRNCLTVPCCRLSTYGCRGCRAFHYAGVPLPTHRPDSLDGRTTHCGITALCVASRRKNPSKESSCSNKRIAYFQYLLVLVMLRTSVGWACDAAPSHRHLYTIRQPELSHCALLSTQHERLSGVPLRRPDSLDGRTDGRTTHCACDCGITALCVASRGKNPSLESSCSNKRIAYFQWWKQDQNVKTKINTEIKTKIVRSKRRPRPNV